MQQPNSGIAKEMPISVNTADHLRQQVYRKSGCRDNTLHTGVLILLMRCMMLPLFWFVPVLGMGEL
jgi:hypothetical protein